VGVSGANGDDAGDADSATDLLVEIANRIGITQLAPLIVWEVAK
jgi:hypothetical protein